MVEAQTVGACITAALDHELAGDQLPVAEALLIQLTGLRGVDFELTVDHCIKYWINLGEYVSPVMERLRNLRNGGA